MSRIAYRYSFFSFFSFLLVSRLTIYAVETLFLLQRVRPYVEKQFNRM